MIFRISFGGIMKKLFACCSAFALMVAFSSCGSKSVSKMATKAGINFGTAVQPGDIVDPVKSEILKKNFNCLVPENNMKMANIRPTKKLWNWGDMDMIVDFAQENGMKVRGHTFIWHQQNSTIINQIKTKEEAIDLIKENITEIMTRYKGKIYEYDVANEIFDDDGSFRQSFWYRKCGTDIYEEAFRHAKTVDPDAKLFLNDYSHEEAGTPKAEAFYGYVKSLVEKGVPIDGVGFQLHLCTDYGLNEEKLRQNIRRFADLGLTVSFTEIDIRMKVPATESDAARQTEMYLTLMDVLKSEPNVDTYMVWGYNDGTSWVPGTFPGYGSAHLFDKDLKAKPVFDLVCSKLKK